MSPFLSWECMVEGFYGQRVGCGVGLGAPAQMPEVVLVMG